MRCECCGSVMVKLNDWIMTCRDCGFQSSTLEPAEGTGIPGLEDLRRENFKRLLDRIEAHKPLKNARVLEVGSAWGWFLERLPGKRYRKLLTRAIILDNEYQNLTRRAQTVWMGQG